MSFCGLCQDAESKLAKKIDKFVEKKLKSDKNLFKQEYKLLILGTGESGKSTFLKQIRIIHGQGFSENERASFINSIRINLFTILNGVLEISYGLGFDKDTDKNFKLSVEQIKLFNIDEDKVFDSYIQSIKYICDKDEIKNVIANFHKFKLPDSTDYFLRTEIINKILSNNYNPDLDDILRLRIPTTGIIEYTFTLNSVHFRMVDVGGQRSERRKWIHCFDNVTSIIFIVSMSEYDQTLVEDPSQNRIIESLALFKTIISYPLFLRMSIILFLNKIDIFEKKIKHSPLSKVFPDYTGSEDPKEAMAFILKKFLSVNPYQDKPIYSHFTCATDTKNITFVFDAVRDTILRQNLEEYNLV